VVNPLNWKRYERFKAKEHRGRHVGGPGKADYIRGSVKGEVKHRSTPVTKTELAALARRGIREIDSLSGYTGSAIEYADRYRPYLKLFKRGRRQ
jgi:hypothetical protein